MTPWLKRNCDEINTMQREFDRQAKQGDDMDYGPFLEPRQCERESPWAKAIAIACLMWAGIVGLYFWVNN